MTSHKHARFALPHASRRWAWLVPLVLLLQGCAHSWVDEHNVRHVVGFFSVEVIPAPPGPSAAGQTIRVRSVGLSVTTADIGSAIVLGYQDTALTAIRNHSLVRLPQASLNDPPHAPHHEATCLRPDSAGL